MQYRIKVTIVGPNTGYRESYLKAAGKIQEFSDRETAERMAADYRIGMTEFGATATVEPVTR